MNAPDLLPQNQNSENMNWCSLSPELREAVKAVATPEEIHSICEKSVPNTTETIDLQQRIVDNVREQGNHALSVEILNFMLSRKQQSIFIGPQHTSTLETMFELAQELGSMGSYAQAEDVWTQLLGLYKELGIHDNLKVMYNLAIDFNHDKKYAKAEDLLKQVLPQLSQGQAASDRNPKSTVHCCWGTTQIRRGKKFEFARFEGA